jgi:hypothetical protein
MFFRVWKSPMTIGTVKPNAAEKQGEKQNICEISGLFACFSNFPPFICGLKPMKNSGSEPLFINFAQISPLTGAQAFGRLGA